MMNKMKYVMGMLLLALLSGGFASCQHEEENPTFGDKCIKRSLGPNVWSTQMEFAYAMAIQPSLGNLVEAKVEASIPGAEGTLLENQSWHAKLDGMDTAIVVGEPCVTEGTLSTVKFNVDTCASTLRYYYTIPEEAKGKEVSFTFSATASNGETVSIPMGPYTIASMDMKLDIALTAAKCYISLEDMAAYTAAEAATMPDKIDLVYLFRKKYDQEGELVAFNHAFVSPAPDAKEYLSDVELPAGVNRSTKVRDVGIKDAHLARLHLKDDPEAQPAIFIDDIDLRDMDMSTMPNYALDLITNDGMFIETQDGKYKAYVYINKANSGRAGATISMKRYTMY